LPHPRACGTAPRPPPPHSRRCTAPGFLDTILLLSGRPHDGLVPSCSGITGTAQPVLFDQPLGVVAGDEVADGVTDRCPTTISRRNRNRLPRPRPADQGRRAR